MSSHDAAIYAANDLIMPLTKPQPPNPFLLIGDEQIAALQKLADIFKTTTTKQPISTLGVSDIEPPNHPRTHSQTKQCTNAALTTPPTTNLLQTALETTIHQQKEGDMFPETFLEPPIDVSHPHKPCIVPIIANL